MTRPKALGYVRVSTTEQVRGFGLPVQEKAIRAYCRAHDVDLVEVLRDEGQSGSNGLDTRLGLAAALARLERGEATILVVARLDRLARDLRLQLTIIDQLEKAGQTVVSVAEPDVDGPDELRDLIRNLLGSIGEYERALIRGRMMAGKAAKKAAGGYVGGRPPYGFRVVNGEVVNDPEEMPVRVLIGELHLAGRSLREIIEELNRRGLRPRSGEWHPTMVNRIVVETPRPAGRL